jgi:hypothetical protein
VTNSNELASLQEAVVCLTEENLRLREALETCSRECVNSPSHAGHRYHEALVTQANRLRVALNELASKLKEAK